MAAIAISPFRAKFRKKRFSVRKNAALAFINGIDSNWKGNLPFVFWLTRYFRPKTIVDLGFDRGLSTIAFAYRNRGHVFGVDWFEEESYVAKSLTLDRAFLNISDAIRFHYAKNIHLIMGPFKEISKTWTRKIDILHIGWAHSYPLVKRHFENWNTYLNAGGIILISGVSAFPAETGVFFNELPLHKFILSGEQGLGVASADPLVIDQVKTQFLAINDEVAADN